MFAAVLIWVAALTPLILRISRTWEDRSIIRRERSESRLESTWPLWIVLHAIPLAAGIALLVGAPHDLWRSVPWPLSSNWVTTVSGALAVASIICFLGARIARMARAKR
jgi:hypothetical protein